MWHSAVNVPSQVHLATKGLRRPVAGEPNMPPQRVRLRSLVSLICCSVPQTTTLRLH